MKIFSIAKKKKKKGITYTGWGNDCGGYSKMPKDKTHSGKLDNQLFPNCASSDFPIVTAHHAQNVMTILDAWRNKKIDNERFVKEMMKIKNNDFFGVSEDPTTRNVIQKSLEEAAQTKNYDAAATKIATFLGYTEHTHEPGEEDAKKKRNELIKDRLNRFRI